MLASGGRTPPARQIPEGCFRPLSCLFLWSHNMPSAAAGSYAPPRAGARPRRRTAILDPRARSEGITLAEASNPPSTPESAPANPQQQQQQQRSEIVLDDKQAHAAYANFARVT